MTGHSHPTELMESFSSEWSCCLSGVCQCQGCMDRIISCASRVSWLETPQSIDLSVITQAVLALEKLPPEVLNFENRIKYRCGDWSQERTVVLRNSVRDLKQKSRQILTHVVCHLQWQPESSGNTKKQQCATVESFSTQANNQFFLIFRSINNAFSKIFLQKKIKDRTTQYLGQEQKLFYKNELNKFNLFSSNLFV